MADQTIVIDITTRYTDNTSAGFSGMRSQINNASNALTQFQSRTQRSTEQIGKAHANVGGILSKVKGIGAKAVSIPVRIVDKATRPLRKIMNYMTSLKGIAATVMAGFAVNKLIRKPIQLADQTESARLFFGKKLSPNGNEAAQNKAANSFMKEIYKFDAQSPFNTQQIIQNTKTMMGYGWKKKDVLKDLGTIGDASSALGQGTEGIQGMMIQLAQTKMRSRPSQQDIGILQARGIDAWKYIAEGMKLGSGDKAKAKAKELATAGKLSGAQATEYMIAGMKRDFGGQSKALANKTVGGIAGRITSGLQSNIAVPWGEGLSVGAKKGLKGIADFLDENTDKTKKLGTLLGKMGSKISTKAADHLLTKLKNISSVMDTKAFKKGSVEKKLRLIWDAADIEKDFEAAASLAVKAFIKIFKELLPGLLKDTFTDALKMLPGGDKPTGTSGGSALLLGLLTTQLLGSFGGVGFKGIGKLGKKIFKKGGKGAAAAEGAAEGAAKATSKASKGGIFSKFKNVGKATEEVGKVGKTVSKGSIFSKLFSGLKGASKGGETLNSISKIGAIGKAASKAFMPAAVLTSGISVLSAKKGQKNRTAVGEIGGLAGGAGGGALAGAAIGSVVPGIGTAIGSVIGGLAGYAGGKKAGTTLFDVYNKYSKKGGKIGRLRGGTRKGMQIGGSDAMKKGRASKDAAKLGKATSSVAKSINKAAKDAKKASSNQKKAANDAKKASSAQKKVSNASKKNAKANKSMSKVSKGANKANSSLRKVGSAARKSSGGIRKLSSASRKSASGVRKLSSAARKSASGTRKLGSAARKTASQTAKMQTGMAKAAKKSSDMSSAASKATTQLNKIKAPNVLVNATLTLTGTGTGTVSGGKGNAKIKAGPGHAAGTNNARKGMAWVGENGPELMMFNGGEKVFTADKSRRMAKAGMMTTRGHAAGTNNARKGPAWVGENGPELMMFNGGEKVYNKEKSHKKARHAGRAGSRNGAIEVNVGGITFQINGGGSSKKVVEQIRANLPEITNEIAGHLAKQMKRQYRNSPVGAEGL
ncbi:MAG: hypothetical protein VB031_02145 [Eubacteriaceae bacterium]|nr:hypothetical protein [Eubacteriaceae bacterium]